MRLIDADKFKELFNDGTAIGRIVMSFIDEQPTAYDVDKVVGQLEECKRIMESPVQQDCYGEECKVGDCIVCAFDKALDIVKEGGVNG